MSLDSPPEVHGAHGRPRGGPPPWLEWTTSIAALVVSVSSIVIAVHHGDTMDKLVKANSFPYLIGSTSDADLEGRDRLSIDLINNGVGPADERSLTIKVGDRYVTSVKDLIRTIVGPGEGEQAATAVKALKNSTPTRFIAPKDRGLVFRIDKTPENARYWDMVDRSMTQGWTVEYCYCSVFEECWAVRNEAHRPVKQCQRDEPHEFIP